MPPPTSKPPGFPAPFSGSCVQASDPDAVEELEEQADAQAQEGWDHEGAASTEGLQRVSGRASSDESETSALGL